MRLRKHLPFMILMVVVALVIGVYLGFTSLSDRMAPPTVRDLKVPPANIITDDGASQSSTRTEKGKTVSTQDIKETNVPEVNPKAGEIMVWGEVKAVDIDKRVLTIDQQMDDNSVKISPNVAVNKEAIIRTKEKVISLAQVKLGDSVGIIVTKNGQARAVLVNY